MEYDPFQKEAISCIDQGHSVLVAAPTGAGKTAIAEHVIRRCLARHEKVIYTAPIKTISNQKYRDFSKDYPREVGILTGDVTLNPHASTLIMTTEIFRNKILEEHSDLKHYSWIIFDEMHYIDDIERGSVWEESLMFLPDHMNILGLSATIPNIQELASWLKSIHTKPFKVVIEHKRPVPLHFFFQSEGEIYKDLKILKHHVFARAQARIHPYMPPKMSRPKFMANPNPPSELIRYLQGHNCLPCIYFSFGRRRCEALAHEIRRFNFLNPAEQGEIRSLYDSLCEKYDIRHEPSTYDLKPLIENGMAYHHAGMLPTLKEVVEQIFTTRLIKIIFTTETFALGINMPARTVVFDELRKIYGPRFETIKTRDFYQMAGRAGRRGIDEEGYVFCRVDPGAVPYHDLSRILYGEPEKVASRFNASYATILNLYASHGEKLYDIYPFSLHYYQEETASRRQAIDLLRMKVNCLKQLGHIRKNKITEKGEFARRVYGYELMLSELYAAGILEGLSIGELGILALAIVFEPRKGAPKPHLPPSAKKLQRLTNNLLFPILRMEHTFHVKPHTKACFYHLSRSLEDWIRGRDFGDILKDAPVDEGEVIRYFRMGVQVLREILDAPVSEALKAKLLKTIDAMNRDEIDAEKQLRGY
jgi:superfamily II RNA helicase